MNKRIEKLKNRWLAYLKRKRELEKKKKENERLGLLFYFKKIFLVSGTFLFGLFLPKKIKKEETIKINIEEKLENIKKIKKHISQDTLSIDKVNDCKLSLEIEEIEIQDQMKHVSKPISDSIIELNKVCQDEINVTRIIINQKIKNFENRLQENFVKKEPLEIEEIKEKHYIDKKDEELIKDEVSTPVHVSAAEVTLAVPSLIANAVLSKDEDLDDKDLDDEDLDKNEDVTEDVIVTEMTESKQEQHEDKIDTENSETYENDNVIDNNEVVEEKVDEKSREEKKKLTKEEVTDLLMMSKIIDENIKKNKEKVAELKKEMKEIHPIVRKKSFLGKFKVFMGGMLKSAFSLIPMKLFKNKTIGILTSAVLINNSIRSMRNTMRKEEYFIDYLSYDRVNNKITSTISDMDKIYYICEDSLEQVSSLKRELLSKYEINDDLENIIKEIDSIETNVKSKMLQVEKTKMDLAKGRENVKQKILMKDYFNKQ